jgi:hypothetical protein
VTWWIRGWNGVPTRQEYVGAEWGKLKAAIIEVMKRKDRGLPLPSSYKDSPWIYATKRGEDPSDPECWPDGWTPDKIGKWLIFVPHKEVDLKWTLIDLAHSAGVLGIDAKVSSSLMVSNDTHVICVYTKDWEDQDDVFRVRTKLRRLGFSKILHYKRDVDTRAGRYSGDGKVSIYSD